MAELLSRNEMRLLLEASQGPCLSLYMPAHRAGKDVEQNPIRLKNLSRKAEGMLREKGLAAREVRELLAPVEHLRDDALFWRYQSDGLAIFSLPDLFRAYRLPLFFDELVVVAEHCHIKPLLPLLTGDGQFYVLAVSQNEIRLLQCTRDSVHSVPTEGIPGSLAEALKYDQPEKQTQLHTADRTIYHGHGIAKDYDKVNIQRFFEQVDRGLSKLLANQRAPLVLAGVDYLLAIYREANSYRGLAEQGIPGNPEGLDPDELRKQAWPIVAPLFLAGRQKAVEQYGQLKGTGRATADLETIVPAAYQGRLEVLLTALDERRWGKFNPETGEVVIHDREEPGDDDLLNFAALHTYLHDGTAYALPLAEMPDKAAAAALLRY